MPPLPRRVRLLPWLAIPAFAAPLLPTLLEITLSPGWNRALALASGAAGGYLLGVSMPRLTQRRQEQARQARDEYRQALSGR